MPVGLLWCPPASAWGLNSNSVPWKVQEFKAGTFSGSNIVVRANTPIDFECKLGTGNLYWRIFFKLPINLENTEDAAVKSALEAISTESLPTYMRKTLSDDAFSMPAFGMQTILYNETTFVQSFAPSDKASRWPQTAVERSEEIQIVGFEGMGTVLYIFKYSLAGECPAYHVSHSFSTFYLYNSLQ